MVRDVMRGTRHAARWLLSVGWLSRLRWSQWSQRSRRLHRVHEQQNRKPDQTHAFATSYAGFMLT
ncbi:hypothetical protein SCB29_09015 [Paraburkholderia sp. SIMBA_055]